MQIPVSNTLGIDEFVGGEITVPVSRVINGIFEQRSDGTAYITQRPSIDIAEDASATVSNARGRGVFYWEAVTANYFVNDNKVYKGDYSTEVNEASVSVTDIDGDGTTATATATSHGYVTGDKITISSSTSFDGEYTITKTGANTFTFPHASSNINETGNAVRGLGGGGTERVTFHEIGNYLVILDHEDNKGWYINSGSSTVLVEITDTDFPGHLSSNEMSRGGCVLDGTLYVMDKNGNLAGSDIEDPTVWDSLNTINAEVEQDGGVALAAHRNHVVAFGNRTIEFFYDAANASGSPLAVRQDVTHEIGAVDFSTAWGDQNVLFFVGQTRAGGMGVYMMDGFMPSKISTTDIDTFLTSAVHTDGKSIVGSGFSTGSGMFYVLTTYHVTTNVVPLESIVYNPVTGTWTQWELMHSGVDDCPIIDWTVANATRLGYGILSNGDVITVGDDWSPYDSTGATEGLWVVADDVFEDGVFTNTSSSASSVVISMEIVTGDSDYGTTNRKRMDKLRLTGPVTGDSQTLTVQWSDEDNNDYNAGRTLDTSVPGRSINRLGSFRRRNFKFTYAGSEKWEFPAPDANVQGLNY